MSLFFIKLLKMPQATLPLFTDDMTIINLHLGVQKHNGMVYYFNGMLPFYQHREDDRSNFKQVICQMLINEAATRSQLSTAFQIPERTISRWLSAFKQDSGKCFYVKKK
jgi:hypothetical protein